MAKKEDFAINIKGLNKTFKTKVKSAGIKGSIKSIFKPKFKKIDAVKDVSFDIKKGELVAFIGPNGAGKSTTLKMLSGILFPDSGNIGILGLSPQKERKKLAYKIGTVFGQKPQLWFHLPAIDSFNLFARIYELDMDEYKKRLDYLIKQFDIKDIINQPVRKLSLGQRMRCEFVLSLLHNPKILFLDEPTIGIDLVVKKGIRSLIKKINQKENVTVLLTSHDMGDVETICKRVIIINDGCIIYDGALEDIKKKYLKTKIISVVSDTPVKIPKRKGIVVVSKKKFSAKIEVDFSKIKTKQVIDLLMKSNQINDITVEEPPIEEIIEEIFQKGKIKVNK